MPSLWRRNSDTCPAHGPQYNGITRLFFLTGDWRFASPNDGGNTNSVKFGSICFVYSVQSLYDFAVFFWVEDALLAT